MHHPCQIMSFKYDIDISLKLAFQIHYTTYTSVILPFISKFKVSDKKFIGDEFRNITTYSAKCSTFNTAFFVDLSHRVV